MCADRKPWLIGFQVSPPSSVRNAPAAEMAITIRFSFCGSITIVCKHIPPAPGAQCGPDPCFRNPDISSQFLAPSPDLKIAASSIPAYTNSGSEGEGSRCQTRLNSHGCAVPSYHWCVPGTPSYSNLFPTASQVLPPSSDR